MKQSISKLLGALALSSLASLSMATVYTYSNSNPAAISGGEAGRNTMTYFSTSYDSYNQSLSFSNTWATSASNDRPDGFWVVLSDGPNPKGINNQLPIFYVDFNQGLACNPSPCQPGQGSTPQNRITAYTYDGVNGPFSYNTNPSPLQSWENAITMSSTTNSFSTNFSINMAALNTQFGGNVAGNGLGADFSNQVGVWFHWFDECAPQQITYAANTSATKTAAPYKISNFSYQSGTQGWLDGQNFATTSKCSPGDKSCGGGKVPEPMTPLLIGIGIMGMFAARRKFSKA
jgi:PEP-CTERM motif